LRDKGKLLLTPAGRELYVQWSNLLQYFENSIEDASSQQEGVMSRFVVGVGYLMPTDHLERLRKAYRSLAENIKVHFESRPQSTAWDRLRNGEVDIIMVSGHILPDEKPSDIDWCILQESDLAVFVSKENPLSRKEEITFADLREEEFIVFSSDTDSRYMQLLNHLSSEAGFTPRISCYVPDESSFAINLWMNNGIVLADQAMLMDDTGIKCFPLEGRGNHLYLAWRIPKEVQRRFELKKVTDAIIEAFQNS
jgi:DNA-binding transcriptional LysR family regulator